MVRGNVASLTPNLISAQLHIEVFYHSVSAQAYLDDHLYVFNGHDSTIV